MDHTGHYKQANSPVDESRRTCITHCTPVAYSVLLHNSKTEAGLVEEPVHDRKSVQVGEKTIRKLGMLLKNLLVRAGWIIPH